MAKSLVLYFSYTGNVRHLARMIADETGADLFEVEPVEAYPADYSQCVKQAKEEINRKYHPPIKGLPENMDQYDTVYVGSPIWWYTMAPPMATALESIDWNGKTVYPFCSHGGIRTGNYRGDVAAACTGAEVKKMYSAFRSGIMAKRGIKNWLNQ